MPLIWTDIPDGRHGSSDYAQRIAGCREAAPFHFLDRGLSAIDRYRCRAADALAQSKVASSTGESLGVPGIGLDHLVNLSVRLDIAADDVPGCHEVSADIQTLNRLVTNLFRGLDVSAIARSH